MHPCTVVDQGVNRKCLMGTSKVPIAVDFLAVTSQSRVSLVLAFGAPAACVAAASKFPAFAFVYFVVFCSRKKEASSGVHRWDQKDQKGARILQKMSRAILTLRHLCFQEEESEIMIHP
jgi:hypothetical protein